MRRWWERIFVVAILLISAGAIYAIWPDQPDRYLPDGPWPSGRGVPSEVLGLRLPCHSGPDNENPSANCRGMTLGLDLQGGSRIVLAADLQGEPNIDVEDGMRAAQQIVERRINPFGVSEANVQRSGTDRLIVELPGVSAAQAEDITRPAVLTFCEPLQQGEPRGGIESPIALVPPGTHVVYTGGTCQPDIDEEGRVAVVDHSDDGEDDPLAGLRRVEPTYTQYAPGMDGDSIVWTPAQGEVDGNPTTMTGAYLRPNARVDFDFVGQPALIFNMTNDGQRVFGSLTERMVGLPLATFLDGEPVRGQDGRVIAPTIQSQITDTGQTTGLTLSDAERLRTFLNTGAFPIPLRVIQQQDIDATLGDEAVRHSVQAGIVAMLLIMGFMTLYYRLPGLLASLALVIYTSLVLAIFKIGVPGTGPVTLTLAGIAAFVLSVGMAVDANILIFERTKEELRNGRSLIPAVEAGFRRAWTSIRDSNVATLITCAILYWMGDSFNSPLIKGFALTLAIGVALSMFSAILVTRSFLRVSAGTPLARRIWLWTDDRPDDETAVRAREALAGAEVVERA
jgi:preprotein translocase subunit SecD